jgi:hypothetical protein
MNIREIEWEVMNWIHLALHRDQWGGAGVCCEHGSEPSGSIKGEEFLNQLG